MAAGLTAFVHTARAEAAALWRSLWTLRQRRAHDPAVVEHWQPTRQKRRRKVRRSGTRLGHFERYTNLCYRHVGRHLDGTPDRHLEDRLKQADVRMTSGMFRGMVYVSSAVVTVAATLLALVLLLSTIGGIFAVPLAVGVGVATGATTAAAMRLALGSRIGNRRTAVEKELAFALSELGVLASIGLSPIEIMRRMAQREDGSSMTREFRKIVSKADIQGRDLVTALAETAKECPSEVLRETLWDIGNMIHQGSDLGAYIETQAADILELKRARQKEFIDQLTTYTDMYVTIVLIGIIFVGIGAFVMDAFGMGAGGLDADALLKVLTYGAIPFIVIVIAILLSTAHGQVD